MKVLMMKQFVLLTLVVAASPLFVACTGGVNGGGGNDNTAAPVDNSNENDAGGACSSDAACNDGDACTSDACVAGACVSTSIENCPPPDDGNGGEPPAGRAVRFPDSSVWYEDISTASLDAESDDVIAWLEANGGWGTGEMRIDYSIEVLTAGEDAPVQAFAPTEDHFFPDCDLDPVPVPVDGVLEGEDGLECTNDGDCHLIVVDPATNTLYEMWRANIVVGEFFGGCLSVWDLTRDYGGAGRGRDCTSADAAGFPIAPLLFTADDVAAGEIDHAIRFILPNARIRNRIYVSPATHSTGATIGGPSAPPYGARFRLRSDYPIDTLPSEGARVVALALQRYGMFLADAGNIALTAQSDRYSTAKWDGLLDTRDLTDLSVPDFEMIEGGTRYEFTGDCVRID